MESMIEFDEFAKSLHYISENSKKYAQAKANRVHLEQFRKSQKAMLMLRAQEEGKRTGQEREAYAYSHPEYLQTLDGLKAAVEIEETLKYKIMCAKESIEIKKQINMGIMARMKLY